MRRQEPSMLYVIGRWSYFPPPLYSVGESLKSPGRSKQPGPPQLASPTQLGVAGQEGFWIVPRSSSLGLSTEVAEGFFVTQL